MIANGQLMLGSVLLALDTLDETDYIAKSVSLGSTQTFQRGDHTIHRVERVSTFGRDCSVGFRFKAGRLETVTLYLVDALGEEWRGQEWEMAGLEEEARLHVKGGSPCSRQM